MMNNIKVLWIDDQYESEGSDFIAHAEMLGIDIDGFASHQEGVAELKKNLDVYSAVILDALVKNRKDDQKLALTGLKNSRDFLIELNGKHHLPFYIFTGQPGYATSEDFIESYGEIFVKGRDNKILLERINNDYGSRPRDLFRKQYPEVFEVFNLHILDSNAANLLVEILLNIENKSYSKKNFSPQRDLFEAILKSLHYSVPFIPSDFYDHRMNCKPNHEYCVKFIEGRKVGEAVNNDIVPQYMKSVFRKLKESLNENLHLKEEQEYKYPLLANTFLLLELLVWLSQFAKKNYPNYLS